MAQSKGTLRIRLECYGLGVEAASRLRTFLK
jgi:hypothetical protein